MQRQIRNRELAEISGLSVSTVRVYISTGRFDKLECAREGSDGRCLAWTQESVEKQFGVDLDKRRA